MSGSVHPSSPPRVVSDYFSVHVEDLHNPNLILDVREIGSQLGSYRLNSELELTNRMLMVLNQAVSVSLTEHGASVLQADPQTANDQSEIEGPDEEEIAIFSALLRPKLGGKDSIRDNSRGGTSARYDETRIQRWVRDSLPGSASTRGNHMPDVNVSLRYADMVLISLVGEDAIIKKTGKRGRDDESLFQSATSGFNAIPTNASSPFIAPHDQQLARVWAKKMARLHLYLLSTFEAFGCRLGLLRIHEHYARLYVRDARTIFIECEPAYLHAHADTPASVYMSAADFVQDCENYRHLPHQVTSQVASMIPMIDFVRLAHEMLLSTPLISPLPLIAIPNDAAMDAVVPQSARLTSMVQNGRGLYQCLDTERGGRQFLRPESVSKRAFQTVFADMSYAWSSAEADDSASSGPSSDGPDGPSPDEEDGGGSDGPNDQAPGDDGPDGNGPDGGGHDAGGHDGGGHDGGGHDGGGHDGGGHDGGGHDGGGHDGGGNGGSGDGGGGYGGSGDDGGGHSGGQVGDEPVFRGPAPPGDANDGDNWGHSRPLNCCPGLLVRAARSFAPTTGSFSLPPTPVNKAWPMDGHNDSDLHWTFKIDDTHEQDLVMNDSDSVLQPTSTRRLTSVWPLCATSDDGNQLFSSATRLNSLAESPTRRVVSDPLPQPSPRWAGGEPTESDTMQPPPPPSPLVVPPLPPAPATPGVPAAHSVQGLDKARFLDLAAVSGDTRIRPPAKAALQRAAEDEETIYEAANSELSIRDPAADFAAQLAALNRAHVKVKLVSVTYMDEIVRHHSSAIVSATSAAVGTTKRGD